MVIGDRISYFEVVYFMSRRRFGFEASLAIALWRRSVVKRSVYLVISSGLHEVATIQHYIVRGVDGINSDLSNGASVLLTSRGQ